MENKEMMDAVFEFVKAAVESMDDAKLAAIIVLAGMELGKRAGERKESAL